MTEQPHILIVDDDKQLCELLQDFLGQFAYRITTACNTQQAEKILQKSNIDLMVLDVMMPGEDGLSFCRRLRETSGVPVIILSAMGEEADRIVGLEIGADDYLAKPFSPRELLARVKALLRRSSGELQAAEHLSSRLAVLPDIKFLDWKIDLNKHCLIAPDGLTVPLSSAEYNLLLAFVKHPGRVLTRDQLLDLTSGHEYMPFDRTIDVQVSRLRKKIEPDIKNPEIIITVRGGGYKFIPSIEIDS